jgi:hypothetical protein
MRFNSHGVVLVIAAGVAMLLQCSLFSPTEDTRATKTVTIPANLAFQAPDSAALRREYEYWCGSGGSVQPVPLQKTAATAAIPTVAVKVICTQFDESHSFAPQDYQAANPSAVFWTAHNNEYWRWSYYVEWCRMAPYNRFIYEGDLERTGSYASGPVVVARGQNFVEFDFLSVPDSITRSASAYYYWGIDSIKDGWYYTYSDPIYGFQEAGPVDTVTWISPDSAGPLVKRSAE